MIAGRWFITPHAVRQYQRRCRGPDRYEDALALLIGISERAHYVKEAHEGMELWRTGKPDGRLRLIVSRRLQGQPQLVTVLKGHDGS